MVIIFIVLIQGEFVGSPLQNILQNIMLQRRNTYAYTKHKKIQDEQNNTQNNHTKYKIVRYCYNTF